MSETKVVAIPDNPNVNTIKDIFTLVLAFAGAIKLLLAAPPFNFAIPATTWEAVINLISVGFAGYGIYKNTYALSKKAKQQKVVLQKLGLKDAS